MSDFFPYTIDYYMLIQYDCACACVMQFVPLAHKKTLACHWVSSSSVVRASDLELGGLWNQIPSGAQIFSESPYGRFIFALFLISVLIVVLHVAVCLIQFISIYEVHKIFVARVQKEQPANYLHYSLT